MDAIQQPLQHPVLRVLGTLAEVAAVSTEGGPNSSTPQAGESPGFDIWLDLHLGLPVYDSNGDRCCIVSEEGDQILEVETRQRVWAPIFPLSLRIELSPEHSRFPTKVAEQVYEYLRSSYEERVAALMTAARNTNPTLNQIIVTTRQPLRVRVEEDSETPILTAYTAIGMIARYAGSADIEPSPNPYSTRHPLPPAPLGFSLRTPQSRKRFALWLTRALRHEPLSEAPQIY